MFVLVTVGALVAAELAASTAVAQSVERIAQMAEQSTGAARASAMTAQQLNALAREMRTITDQYRL